METQIGAFAPEEFVWDLDEDASAVAGFSVAAAGTTVREVGEDLDSLDDDVVRSFTLNIGDEPDTARIALVVGIIKTLGRRESITLANFTHRICPPLKFGTLIWQCRFHLPKLPELL